MEQEGRWRVEGAHAVTRLTQEELLVISYAVMQLRATEDDREFQTLTGGATAEADRLLRDVRAALDRMPGTSFRRHPGATSVAFVGALAYSCPELPDAFSEHLEDNYGEVLPHVFMGDVERWAERWLSETPAGGEPLQRILSFLQDGYGTGDPDIQNLIYVSFLEHLPRPGEPGAGLREMVGEGMRRELDAIG